MALSGRIRSSISLFNKFGYLTSDSLSAQRSTLTRTLIAPANSVVPKASFGGSGNYASALYLAAVKSNVLDKVESEILDLVEAAKNSPTFSQFAKDLSVPSETRVKAVQEIASQAKFSEITTNFLASSTCRGEGAAGDSSGDPWSWEKC